MKKFKVNDYISLLLVNDETIIYVNNKRFQQCKYLLLIIPVDKISSFDEIESIDEAADKLDQSLENNNIKELEIPSEVEFWGHCSNLQVWAENDYDTRLLHRNLAFPLLKRLSEVGDLLAKQKFKDEIIKRIKKGNHNVLIYLINEKFLSVFTEDEFKTLLMDLDINFMSKLVDLFDNKVNPSHEISNEIIYFLHDIILLINNNTEFLTNLVSDKNLKYYDNLKRIQNISKKEDIVCLIEMSNSTIKKINKLFYIKN